MKHLFLLICILISFQLTYGKQVDVTTAKTVGQNYLISKGSSGPVLQLAYKAIGNAQPGSADSITYYYIFSAKPGFVIVSGDDRAIPILGYSTQESFDPNNIPPNFAMWLENKKNEIDYGVKNSIPASDEINSQWQNIKSGYTAPSQSGKTATSSVNPLIQTTWNQAPLYNALCPYDYTYNERTVTGCVATTMAQIMKYWNYPASGNRSHSYSSKYGTLSANFSGTTYQWDSMPNFVLSNNYYAVATLMYQCGIAVGMEYGVAQTDGSGAWVLASDSAICAQNAYLDYFSYDTKTMQGLEMQNYSYNNWISLIKNELNNGRPVEYEGFGSDGGHTWVCDGYDANNTFHMNWGWGGESDGYFSINALDPTALGVGGGAGNFNSYQGMLLGIQPPLVDQNFTMKLNSKVLAPDTVSFNQLFSVSATIVNSGLTTFIGDFCAAIYDTSNNFIGNVAILANQTLLPGTATESLSLSNTAPLDEMLPGNYYVTILYRPTDGVWVRVANNGSFINSAPITVTLNGLNQVLIYPNPAKDNLTIDLSDFTGRLIQISITDLNGRQIMELPNPVAEKKIQLPLLFFDSGIYFVQIKTSVGTTTRKIVVSN